MLTTALGYVAISVGEGQTGGNYGFLFIMIAFVIVAVLANILHPIAWTWEEFRFAVGAPIAVGALAILYGLSRGDAEGADQLGPIAASPIQIGMFASPRRRRDLRGVLVVGRFGFGPRAVPPAPDDPQALLDPPAQAPAGLAPARLRLRPAGHLAGRGAARHPDRRVRRLVHPVGDRREPPALGRLHDRRHPRRRVAAPGGGQDGQQDADRPHVGDMYRYHNNLSSAHPASSPWWAWPFDLKPVWFYEQSFAGGTSASIYDAGNLVAWWLAVPAIGFVAWQAFRRRSAALALIVIAFAVPVDLVGPDRSRGVPVPLLHGAPVRVPGPRLLPRRAVARDLAPIWLLARLSAAAAILGPFGLWLLHRPLCAIARVTEIVPNSQACPTLIPDVNLSLRAIAIAVVVGVGVLLLLRELLALSEEDDRDRLEAERASGGARPR